MCYKGDGLRIFMNTEKDFCCHFQINKDHLKTKQNPYLSKFSI